MNPIGTVWFINNPEFSYNMVVKTDDYTFKVVVPGKFSFNASFTERTLEYGFESGQYTKQYNGRWIK